LSRADPDAALRICAALVWHWRERGRYSEGIEALELALAAAPEAVTGPRAQALGALAMLTGYAGDFSSAPSRQPAMTVTASCWAMRSCGWSWRRR
jgi:hypothetical protein